MSTSQAGQAELAAARLMLERMGISPEDLALAPESRVGVPTFAEYVPVVAAGVTPGTLKAYGSYWNKVVHVWGRGGSTSRVRRISSDLLRRSSCRWWRAGMLGVAVVRRSR